jgi:hypothetical protein
VVIAVQKTQSVKGTGSAVRIADGVARSTQKPIRDFRRTGRITQLR